MAELLEITDQKWVNAVEGYFNKQKFYLVVEPQYYNIALEVYDRKRDRIHTAGIINTKKLPLETEVNNRSLAYVVKSENRYAKAYTNYLLGRVMRCETVGELEEYEIAITPQCMLYQGFVVRHLNLLSYKDPYIGQNAYQTQILNVRKRIEEKSTERNSLREKMKLYSEVLESAKKFDLTILKLYVNAELEKASKDPSLIQLQIELAEKETERNAVAGKEKALENENARLGNQMEYSVQEEKSKTILLTESKKKLEQKMDQDGVVYREAEEKYKLNRKTKTARKIAENFMPQRAQFENEKNTFIGKNERDFPGRFEV